MILFEISDETTSECDSNNGYDVMFALADKIDDVRGCKGDKACNTKKMAIELVLKYGLGTQHCRDSIVFLLNV